MFTVDTSFFFIRHGETDWNAQQRLQGRIDIPLNENGRQQAETAREFLAQNAIDRIISSDLARAHETATIINQAFQKELHTHAALQERHFGILEGMTRPEIEAHPPEKLFHDIVEENGLKLAFDAETLPDFDARVLTAIHHFIHTHAGETLLFVSHGGVFASLCRQLLKRKQVSGNAKPYQFSCINREWSVREID